LEPSDVRRDFISLRSQIDNYCRDLADASISFTAGLGKSNRTVKHPERLGDIVNGPPISLLHSTAQKSGELVDFVECGLAVIVNTFLHRWIYDLFHPQLNSSDSDLLLQIYNSIRLRDPQATGGQWRTQTFNAIESRSSAASKVTSELVTSIEKSVIALLDAVFGTSAWGRKADVDRAQLGRIVQKAYEWNKTVKSTSINLDFDPRIAENDAPFDDVSMAIGKNTTKPTCIICAVNSGLVTSEACGGGMPPTYRWLEQMRVELPR